VIRKRSSVVRGRAVGKGHPCTSLAAYPTSCTVLRGLETSNGLWLPDHRHDLQQWMLAIATVGGSDVPIGLQLLAGNTSDKESLRQQVREVLHQFGGEQETIFVADSGMYSAENMHVLTDAHVRWIARVPETSRAAKATVSQEPAACQGNPERQWWETTTMVNGRPERWIVARSQEGRERSRKTVMRQTERERHVLATTLSKLPQYACEADAYAALRQLQQGTPAWIQVHGSVAPRTRYSTVGRPAAGTVPDIIDWQVQGACVVDEEGVEQEAQRRAWFIVATTVTELPAAEILRRYLEQHSAERGFAFLKDPLFLASSVFVKKPERVMAIGFIMVCCLLLYRLAEYRVRHQLAQREEAFPDQVNKPSQRPTMRWIFQCFEGIHLVSRDNIRQIVGLNDLHLHVLSLLGSLCQQFYLPSD
jgi:transposase